MCSWSAFILGMELVGDDIKEYDEAPLRTVNRL